MKYRLLMMMVTLLLSGSCRPLEEGFTVTLSEFRIDATMTRLPASETQIQVVNEGEFPHTLVVNEVEGRVLGATGLLMPGETTKLTFDPSEGRLMFTCRIVTEIEGGQIIDHYQEGMVAALEVDE